MCVTWRIPNLKHWTGKMTDISSFRTTMEPLMLAAWTKASVDFVAPLVWAGSLSVSWNEILLLASATAALTACGLWVWELARGGRLGLWQPALWTTAGLLLSAAQFPPGVHDFETSLEGKLGSLAWLAAGVVWLGVETGILRSWRRAEVAIVVLWSLSSLGLIVAAARARAEPAEKWTFVSSSVWAAVGCGFWALNLRQGGTLLGRAGTTIAPLESAEDDTNPS